MGRTHQVRIQWAGEHLLHPRLVRGGRVRWSRRDVDVVFASDGGGAAVVTKQTWPQGHPFALLDAVAVEALRGDPNAGGLPLWLTGG